MHRTLNLNRKTNWRNGSNLWCLYSNSSHTHHSQQLRRLLQKPCLEDGGCTQEVPKTNKRRKRDFGSTLNKNVSVRGLGTKIWPWIWPGFEQQCSSNFAVKSSMFNIFHVTPYCTQQPLESSSQKATAWVLLGQFFPILTCYNSNESIFQKWLVSTIGLKLYDIHTCG